MQVSLVINVNVYLLYTSPPVVLIKISQLSQVNMIWHEYKNAFALIKYSLRIFQRVSCAFQ